MAPSKVKRRLWQIRDVNYSKNLSNHQTFCYNVVFLLPIVFNIYAENLFKFLTNVIQAIFDSMYGSQCKYDLINPITEMLHV